MSTPDPPPCMAKYYPSVQPQIYVIKLGTLLYTGARDTFPTSKSNARLPNKAPDKTHYYKYFTPNLEVAKQFATLNLKNNSTSGYVATYRVIKPIPIVLNFLMKNRVSEPYYFDTPDEYASPEAQCLCTEGFHGYATMTDQGLEDIGLCAELGEYLELVDYTTTKSNFTNKTKFGGRHRSRRVRRTRRSKRRV